MDIVAHLNLKAHLAGTPLPFSADAIEQLARASGSDRAKSMGAAERAEEAYWVAGGSCTHTHAHTHTHTYKQIQTQTNTNTNKHTNTYTHA